MRGNIYLIELPRVNCKCAHSVEYGFRPVVVVSSNVGNKTSGVVMVAPITTKIKNLSCNVEIEWSQSAGRMCQVLCNQVMTVPKFFLTKYKGRISPAEQLQVDRALRMTLEV